MIHFLDAPSPFRTRSLAEKADREFAYVCVTSVSSDKLGRDVNFQRDVNCITIGDTQAFACGALNTRSDMLSAKEYRTVWRKRVSISSVVSSSIREFTIYVVARNEALCHVKHVCFYLI
ncbi:hypothetical protein PUN28_016149 [Cardiocondyla obscurior]|uniref:Sema domain-containing protein n=1 Tax=Cardiocondyla obscurior TaxID=286306 RepID=A0AAW2EW53_9HYME